MRPIHLEFCGINSFSEPATIDFTNLLEYGIFGIFGDTGSGKSTILDAIGFALYGDVARSRSGRIADIINYRQDIAYVKFEFEIVFEGRRRTFLVERELKRKNSVQSAKVFERIEGGELLTIADGCRLSNALLLRIIGLEQRDFEKCIALPQGEFAQFVRSPRSDRLKLMARLFDLEAYGERLTKRFNGEYAGACEAVRLAEARLEPYADVSEERNDLLEKELARLKTEETEQREKLAAARTEEGRLAALCEKKAEATDIEEKLSALDKKRSEIEELEGELSRLERAALVIETEREGMLLRTRRDSAAASYQEAEKRFQEAEKAVEAAAQFDEEGAEKEIEKLNELRAKAASAEEVRRTKMRAENSLSEVIQNAAREKNLFEGFSYEEERTALENRLNGLGAGDPFEYIETHGKAALFHEEYATFAGEMQTLTQKHAAISADSAQLIEKYRALSAEGQRERAGIREKFERAKREEEQVRKALTSLEKQKGAYDMHLQRLQQLSDDFTRLKGEIEECDRRLEGAPLVKPIEEALAAAKKQIREKSENKAQSERAYAAAKTQFAATKERFDAAETALIDGRKRFSSALEAGGFASADEAKALAQKYGDPLAAKKRLEGYKAERAALELRKKDLDGIDFSDATKEKLEAAIALREAGEEAVKELTRRIALAEDELSRGQKAIGEKRDLEKQRAACIEKRELLGRLKSLIDGNKFMEYVAEEYLQTVAKNATARLLTLTSGRYFLSYDGGFFVGDNFNGGEKRGVNTLSGGETFLVSLSLALALGAEICAKSLRPIEFFFLDEGFGTLDSHLVDTVMDSLEKLRGEHFSIGIISHVEELKQRMDRKICVLKATDKCGSKITLE